MSSSIGWKIIRRVGLELQLQMADARKPEDPSDHWKCICNKANTIEEENRPGRRRRKS